MADLGVLVGGVVLGLGSSLVTTTVQERFSRRRIIVQRSSEVEGDALVELQDLLIQLPEAWLALIHIGADESRPEPDPEDIYDLVVQSAKPWQRARALASRIIDERTRTAVDEAINTAWPHDLYTTQRLIGTKEMAAYDWQGARAAVDRAIEAIGERLRHPAG